MTNDYIIYNIYCHVICLFTGLLHTYCKFIYYLSVALLLVIIIWKYCNAYNKVPKYILNQLTTLSVRYASNSPGMVIIFKMGPKTKIEYKVIELSYCHHSICLKKGAFKKNVKIG